MGHYDSHMIGIRAGGVFSGDADLEDMKQRIAKVVGQLKQEDWRPGIGGGDDTDPSHCMSGELAAWKGSYVVLAGVFNYWHWEDASEFSRRLSEEFGTEVMHMLWCEEDNEVQCQIFLDGKPLFETAEHPIGRVLRRIG